MAEAEQTTITEEITVERDRIQLTLTHEEAITIAALFNKVGGNPDDTARGLMNDVQSALEEAGAPDKRDLAFGPSFIEKGVEEMTGRAYIKFTGPVPDEYEVEVPENELPF